MDGNGGDSVSSTGQGWMLQARGPITVEGVVGSFNQYTSGAATLLIDTDITQTIS